MEIGHHGKVETEFGIAISEEIEKLGQLKISDDRLLLKLGTQNRFISTTIVVIRNFRR